jgi:hypothetical protein
MILILPCAFGCAKGIALLATLDFIARHLRQECTAAALADQFVDVGNYVNRKDDMRSASQMSRHTLSVT